MNRINRCALVMIVVTASYAGASLAAAGVYRSTDPQGGVLYDDKNLMGERITRAEINKHPVQAEPPQKIDPEFAAKVKRHCGDLTERVSNYRSAAALFARDAQGVSYALSPSQAAATERELEQEKNRFCRPNAPSLLLAEERAAAKRAALRRKNSGKPDSEGSRSALAVLN